MDAISARKTLQQIAANCGIQLEKRLYGIGLTRPLTQG
jgi:hypothetical protein